MQKQIEKLAPLIKNVKFEAGFVFSWSPKTQTISYEPNRSDLKAVWALLHESGHAFLNHRDYDSDVQLLLLEVEAWEKAKYFGNIIDVKIEEDHIQDCIDTYRDWLHQRSTCPRCGVVCLQSKPKLYKCHNCHNSWSVTPARFCRPYRLNKNINTKKPLAEQSVPSTTFM